MSQAATRHEDRLAFHMGDRMRKAREVAGISAGEIAEILEVHRNTVGLWERAKHTPRPRDLRAWAIATRVDVRWLETGELPRLDSNQQPAVYVIRGHGHTTPRTRSHLALVAAA